MKSLQNEAVTPPTPPHVFQDDSAAIPRERSLLIAWWIALVGAVIFIVTAVVLRPQPYREIVGFIGDGLVNTFQITIVSMTFALVLGLLTGLGRTARGEGVKILASLYVEVIRGIPLLAQLFWIYYALSRVVRLGPMVSAVLGLTICYGAYIGETFRAGIQSIPKGQMEAARALGLSRGQAMRHVIIPQAVRIVLPPVGNEFIAMLKDSSLVSVIAISDLLRRGREYASRTFNYFETYTLVALIYLMVTLIFSRVVYYIEQGMSRQTRNEPVSLMHRLAGAVVDLVVLDFVGLILFGLLQPLSFAIEGFPLGLLLAGLMVAITVLYLVFFYARSGRTPGMMAVGIRVCDAEGRIPGLGQVLKRVLLALLPVPGFSMLWMLGAVSRRPLHDRWARTYVVRD